MLPYYYMKERARERKQENKSEGRKSISKYREIGCHLSLSAQGKSIKQEGRTESLQHGKICYCLFQWIVCRNKRQQQQKTKAMGWWWQWLEAMFEFLFPLLFVTLLMEMKMI